MNERYALHDIRSSVPNAGQALTLPARGDRPHVAGFIAGDEFGPWFDVTCWCNVFRLNGTVDVDAWVEQHLRQHYRPQWWVRRWAVQLGRRLERWGTTWP